MKVVMNGIDVTDVTRNFTSKDWDKLCTCGGHSYVYQHREYTSGRGNCNDCCSGRGGRGGRLSGRSSNTATPANDNQQVAAVAVTTDI